MNFSLWLFYDALNEFLPELFHESAINQTIAYIRMGTYETVRDDQTMYIESGDAFFNNHDQNIICIHQNSYLRLQTTDKNLVCNKILAFLEKTQIWYNHINAMISENCMLKDVLNEFKEMLPFPLLMLDASQVTLAFSDNYGEGSLDEYWDRMLATGSFGVDIIQEYNQKYMDHVLLKDFYMLPESPFPYPCYSRNIFLGDELMGFFTAIIKDYAFTEVHKAWFFIAWQCVKNWISSNASQNDVLRKTDVFIELLNGNMEHISHFEGALGTLGWKTKALKRILTLSGVSNLLNIHAHIIKLLNQKSPALYAVEYKNNIVILLNDSMLSKQKIHLILDPIMQNSGYYGGISNTFSSFEELPHYYSQSCLPLFSGRLTIGKLYSCDEYIIPYLFYLIREHAHMNISHPALEQLKTYDRVHQTDLYQLLYLYLKSECRQTETARAAFIHRSTLIRKLKQIQELTHIELDDYKTTFHLMLSYEYEKFDQNFLIDTWFLDS